MSDVLTFISDNIIGLKWINDLVGYILELFGVDLTTTLDGAIQFFIYDTIKIVLLLCVLIFIISYIQSFFPPEKQRKY